jgi:alpha-glucosidase
MRPTFHHTVETMLGDHPARVSFLDETTICVQIAAGDALEEYASYAIVATPQGEVPFTHDATSEEFVHEMTFGGMKVTINRRGAGLWISSGDNIEWLQAPTPGIARMGDGIEVRMISNPADRYFGLGEAGETFEKSGYKHTLWNTDDPHHHPRQNFYAQIPWLVRVRESDGRCVGLFLDNPGRSSFDLRVADELRVATEKGDAILWVLMADSVAELLAKWTHLTGRMERPPMWALGYHQCRWSYFPESRVREIAAEFRARKIPCDALYLDVDYMDGYRVFTWDAERFPNPAGLIGDLAREGFRTVTIVDPGVKIDAEYTVFSEFNAHESWFCLDGEKGTPFQGRVWPGDVYYPDFTRSDVRARWGELQAETLLDLGVAGIWNDMNEPANFDPPNTFPSHVVQDDFGLRRAHDRIHQVYGHTMAQTSYEGMRAAQPDARPFVITRSAYAGVQRFSMVWTGDNQSIWSNMAFDLALNLNMGMTGIAFVGCDIGGFTCEPTPELYARWIEWGVFQPFVRTHAAHDTPNQEPWAFGPEVESIARRMIEWRMRLLPYIYTLFAEAAATGAPVNRALTYEFPHDREARFVGDQFMLGRDMMIAPVLTPRTSRRLVYFPGTAWRQLWTEAHFPQGWHIVEAPLGRPPVFFRAGAVVPMHPVRQHTSDGDVAEWTLAVFADGELSGVLVEDDGATQQWRSGVEAITHFGGVWNHHGMVLHIGPREGTFATQRKRWRIEMHGFEERPHRIQVGGNQVEFAWENRVASIVIDDNIAGVEVVAEA